MAENNEILKWASKGKIQKILMVFRTPKTPRQVEKNLEIPKLKLKLFLRKKLIRCLNPGARKGRFYVLTCKAKRNLKITSSSIPRIDWELFGWVMSSPKQRLSILKTIAVDSSKRTSEEIRKRARKYNPYLARISTKQTLKELVEKNLVETCLDNRRRYYWVSGEGEKLAENILALGH